MLTDSLAALQNQWPESYDSISSSLLDDTSTQLAALARALDTVGLLGARFVAEGLITNISWLTDPQQPADMLENDRSITTNIGSCLNALQLYLSEMSDKAHRDALIDYCAELPCGPSVEQSAFLSGLLALASIQDASAIERRTATEEEVSLASEKDIDPELMSMLYTELPELSEEFALLLQTVSDSDDTDSLREAQRAAHTIKGLANMAGIRGLANLTHYLEDILELLTEAQTLPSERLSTDLLDAGDCLSAMCDSVTGSEPAPETALSCLQGILDWHYLAKTEGIDAITLESDKEAPTSTSNLNLNQ